MSFPMVPRVIYKVNPLDEVICQLRFPPILKIDTELPAAFQERLQNDYPIYELVAQMKLPGNMPPAIAQLMAAELPFVGHKNHTFRSKDGSWTVALNLDFVALTCRAYERWEVFRDRFRVAFDALVDLYNPAHFTRIGLRYRDVIQPSKFGLQGTPWPALLRPEVCGLMGGVGVVTSIQSYQSNAEIRLADDLGNVILNGFLASDADTLEPVFVIDSDFYTESQTELNYAFPKLEAFKHQATNFFRWCITDRLHDALRPEPVSVGPTN